MAIILFLLSFVLMGAGSYALYAGFDIVTTERGLALTLCGTMAFSIGCVVFALGYISVQLNRIRVKLSKPRASSVDVPVVQDYVMQSETTPPDFVPPKHHTAATIAASASVIAVGSALASHMSEAQDVIEHEKHEHIGAEHVEARAAHVETHVDPIAETPLSDDELDKLLNELSIKPEPVLEHEHHQEPELEFEPEHEQEHEAEYEHEAIHHEIVHHEEHVSAFDSELRSHMNDENEHYNKQVHHTPIIEPDIIGTYDSGGVSYTLYSNGSVMAQAHDIIEKYASLEALKAALEDGSSAFKS